VIIAQQNVTVDFNKIKGFSVDTEEFTVLIQDHCVAKTKA
jgi:hypothetical protein